MIDWQRVAELEEEVGQDGLCEVITLFLEETDEVMARLSTDAAPQQLGRDLHFLKEVRSTLACGHLHNCARRRAALRFWGAGRINLPLLRHLYEESKTALRAGQANRPAA
ncbi:Hpt domain-containing protein [Gemmobacter lanyuensis]